MSNHLNSDQNLDQAVKEALESYELPFDSSAWAEMEKQLAAQPKPLNPFKKFSFSLNTIIAVGVVGSGLLIYKLSASNDNHTFPVKEPVVTNEQPRQETPEKDPAPPVTLSAPVTQPADSTTKEAVFPSELATNTPPVVTPLANTNTRTATQPKNPKDKRKSTKDQTASLNEKEGDFDFMKVADRASKSSPAFGDQIDPVKGFINPSNESDNVKKEAFNKTSGWGDQVLKTMKSDSTTREKITPSLKQEPGENDAPDEDTSTDKNTIKKEKPKKTSSTSKDTTSKKKTDEVTSPSTGDEVAEKSDSTEKPRVKGRNNPKYKGDRTIIDP